MSLFHTIKEIAVGIRAKKISPVEIVEGACTRSLAIPTAAGFLTRANASRFGLSGELRVRDAFILPRLTLLSQLGIHRFLRCCEFHPRFLLPAQLH